MTEADAAIEKQRAFIKTRVESAVTVFSTPRLFGADKVYLAERTALVTIGEPAIGDVLAHFQTAKTNTVLQQLGLVLEGIGSRDAISPLLALAAGENVKRAYWAVRTLGGMKNESVIPSLRSLVPVASDTTVRAAALYALAALGDDNGFDFWFAGIRDASEQIRRSSVRALGKMGRAKDGERIIGMIDDNKKSVSLAAIKALGNIKTSESLVALHKLLKRDDPEMIGTALESVNTIGNIELSRSHLREMVSNTDQSREFRERAAHILYRLGDPRGMERLAEPYKKAIRAARRNFTAHRQLADLYYDFGNFKGAAEEYEKSIAANAPYSYKVQTYEKIARCHAQSGNFKRAADYLVKSGRSNDWTDLFEDDDFQAMKSDRRYGKYFQKR